MTRHAPLHRRLTAMIVATLMVAVGVAVPLIDGNESVRGPVLESEHHAASCVVGHDHTICTQVGANHALTTPLAGTRAPSADALSVAPSGATIFVGRHFVAGHRSRAPPVVLSL